MNDLESRTALHRRDVAVDRRRDLRGLPYVDVDGRLRVRFFNGLDQSVNPRFLDVLPGETADTVHDRFKRVTRRVS